MEEFNRTIKNYLDERAANDPQFAKRYQAPGKSIRNCCKYIVGTAKKNAVNGTCIMTDDEVYGLAVHYYDEDNIELEQHRDDEARVVVGRTPEHMQKLPAKASKKNVSDNQLSFQF